MARVCMHQPLVTREHTSSVTCHARQGTAPAPRDRFLRPLQDALPNANSTDTYTFNEDRQPSAEEQSVRNGQRRDAVGKASLERACSGSRQGGRSRLHLSNLSALQSRAVHAIQVPKEPARIDNRNTHGQISLRRVRHARSNNLLCVRISQLLSSAHALRSQSRNSNSSFVLAGWPHATRSTILPCV